MYYTSCKQQLSNNYMMNKSSTKIPTPTTVCVRNNIDRNNNNMSPNSQQQQLVNNNNKNKNNNQIDPTTKLCMLIIINWFQQPKKIYNTTNKQKFYKSKDGYKFNEGFLRQIFFFFVF